VIQRTIELVEGDNLKITRTIRNIPPGDSLAKAVMTLKANITDADPGVLQKSITTTDVPGTGQITDSGASDLVGAVRFDFVTADTVTTLDPRDYLYDITVKTTLAAQYTVERGVFTVPTQITTTTT